MGWMGYVMGYNPLLREEPVDWGIIADWGSARKLLTTDSGRKKLFYYNPRAVLKILEGDYRYITNAFTWLEAPFPTEWVNYQEDPKDLPPDMESFLVWLSKGEQVDDGEME